MRTPVFELHILPMIRATDREHMLNRNLDLWDYDTLVQHADEVEARVGDAKDMPTARTGGPWPDVWIELFRRWRATNFKRLVMGTAEYTFRETGTSPSAIVQAKGTFPAAGYKGWLQIEAETLTEKTYVLYFEAPDDATEEPGVPFTITESYRVPTGSPERRQIFVRDKEAHHLIHQLPSP
jgi:hypothetical protein